MVIWTSEIRTIGTGRRRFDRLALEEPMNRRSIFGAGLAAMAIVPLFGRKAAAAPEKKQHKLAIHVDQNDAAVMRLALGNARNTHELYTSMGDDVAIEIVCYSQGLHMVRQDTSPVKDEIRSTRTKVPQLAFSACNNTKRAMEKTEGKTIPLIDEAVVVPAGVVRLIDLQEQGFKYIKP
jgi:intracellular sulfur oxidation DsrE/DsrF family protein